MKIMHDVAHLTPSSAVRITRNPGKGAYFGEKYQVDVVSFMPVSALELMVAQGNPLGF